ncbi:MAG: SDR family NAD(P)-dependent oxidoreductase [Rhodothermales bacterium]
MYNLKDRIVFVTGASSGIGRATAVAAGQAGADVIVAARRSGRLDELVGFLQDEVGVRALAVQMDVTDREGVRSAVAALPPEWMAVDVLVNNAGKALGLATSFETTAEHLDGMLDTNVKGLLYVTQAVLPGMLERGRGHVINIGSTAGHWVYPGGTVYCASKHAVHALNEGLKMDVHGTPVRVSAVSPGLVETEFSIVRFEGDSDRADSVYANMTPLTPEDVADAILWCATRPPHVNISEVLMMCVDQSHATLVNRKSK